MKKGESLTRDQRKFMLSSNVLLQIEGNLFGLSRFSQEPLGLHLDLCLFRFKLHVAIVLWFRYGNGDEENVNIRFPGESHYRTRPLALHALHGSMLVLENHRVFHIAFGRSERYPRQFYKATGD